MKPLRIDGPNQREVFYTNSRIMPYVFIMLQLNDPTISLQVIALFYQSDYVEK